MIGLAMLMAFGTQAAPQYVIGTMDGEALYQACRADPAGLCLGYVAGVYDDIRSEDANSDDPRVCPSPKVTVEQIRDIVVRWLADNPAKRIYSGADLVEAALEQAWPCIGVELGRQPSPGSVR
jgi:hypothetical protein